ERVLRWLNIDRDAPSVEAQAIRAADRAPLVASPVLEPAALDAGAEAVGERAGEVVGNQPVRAHATHGLRRVISVHKRDREQYSGEHVSLPDVLFVYKGRRVPECRDYSCRADGNRWYRTRRRHG